MLNIPHYQSQLHQLVDRDIQIEPKMLLDRLSKEKTFEFEGKSDISRFPLKLKKTLEKIAKLRIGQELLTFICDHQTKPLNLNFFEESNFSLNQYMVNLNPRSFVIWKNPNETQCFHMPFKVSFVHELFHCKHSLENIDKYKKMGFPTEPQDLLYPELHDAEEELAICGLDADDKGADIVLCENHFRYAWKLPLRFTHQGEKSPQAVIQKDVPIEPKRFAALFGRYHKKLVLESYRKQVLIVDISKPNSHQRKLMKAIKPFVQVHNIALISDLEKVKALKTNELYDYDLESCI